MKTSGPKTNLAMSSFGLSLALSSAAPALAKSPNFFWRNHDSVLSRWEPKNFTKVEEFNPRKFRFIYQTVTGWQWPEIQPGTAVEEIASNPEYVTNNPKISATVIDQDHRKIFRQGVGLILEVPTSNLIFTAIEDAGSPWQGSMTFVNVYDEMSDFIARNDLELLSPQEIMDRTDVLWNEIGVLGREPLYGDSVEVKAVVITAKALNCETNEERNIQDLSWIRFRYILWRCGFKGEWIDRMMGLKERYPILLMNL